MYCVFIARTSSGVENLNIISDTGVADKLPQNCIVEGSIAKSSEGLFIVLIFLMFSTSFLWISWTLFDYKKILHWLVLAISKFY